MQGFFSKYFNKLGLLFNTKLPFNVFYSVAHSGQPGAITQQGITENLVAKNAWNGFSRVLPESIYINLPLKSAIDHINTKCTKNDIAIQLHFNMSGLEKCKCGKTIYKGTICANCGTPSQFHIKYGILCVSWKTNKELCDFINMKIHEITPFQTIMQNQLVPDPSVPATERPNNLAWPKNLKCKSIIIEAGFGCDKNFADWIAINTNQIQLGACIAQAIREFHEKNIR